MARSDLGHRVISYWVVHKMIYSSKIDEARAASKIY